MNTHIANVIEGNANKSKYDTEIKKILGDKTILSWILKYCTDEFKEYEIELIRECIEDTPEIGTQKVYPGYTPEEITGMNTEDCVVNEGSIYYDVKFYAMTPDKMPVKLIINVEGQKSYYPGYDLVTRAVFYCARMLSAQLDKEFTTNNYNNIKKVYSIWICLDVPKYNQYTITRYRMIKEDLHRHSRDDKGYDLLCAVMICLGDEEDAQKGTKLQNLLNTILSDKLNVKEKEKILEEEYGFETSIELEGGLKRMCNLSELIEERAEKKGIEQGLLPLVSMVKKGIVSLEDAINEVEDSNKELFLSLISDK